MKIYCKFVTKQLNNYRTKFSVEANPKPSVIYNCRYAILIRVHGIHWNTKFSHVLQIIIDMAHDSII